MYIIYIHYFRRTTIIIVVLSKRERESEVKARLNFARIYDDDIV